MIVIFLRCYAGVIQKVTHKVVLSPSKLHLYSSLALSRQGLAEPSGGNMDNMYGGEKVGWEYIRR